MDDQSAARIPRHFGNVLHPQNSRPAFAPCFAVRFTISAPQRGQVGVFAFAAPGAVLLGRAVRTGAAVDLEVFSPIVI